MTILHEKSIFFTYVFVLFFERSPESKGVRMDDDRRPSADVAGWGLPPVLRCLRNIEFIPIKFTPFVLTFVMRGAPKLNPSHIKHNISMQKLLQMT